MRRMNCQPLPFRKRGKLYSGTLGKSGAGIGESAGSWMKRWKNIWMMALLTGCGSGPVLMPKNEINEPIFHTTDFTGLQAGTGAIRSRVPDSSRYRPAIYFAPALVFDRPVSAWASYSLLPVYWNLLLTGEQYADGSTLRTGKPALALHGGVSGISYSQRSGWQTTAALSLDMKMVWNRFLFTDMGLGALVPDVATVENSMYHWAVGMGGQISERNSLKLEYGYTLFLLEPFTAYRDHEILFGHRDDRSNWSLRHSFYAGRRHVMGPEGGFLFKNSDFRTEHAWWYGIHYAYRFH